MEAVPSESVQLVSVPQRASLARERVRLSTHLTWLFDVKTQLPHRGNKLRLVFVDLHISEYVVYETGESRGCLGTGLCRSCPAYHQRYVGVGNHLELMTVGIIHISYICVLLGERNLRGQI